MGGIKRRAKMTLDRRIELYDGNKSPGPWGLSEEDKLTALSYMLMSYKKRGTNNK